MGKFTLKRTEKAPFDLQTSEDKKVLLKRKTQEPPYMVIARDNGEKKNLMSRNKRQLWKTLCKHPFNLSGEEKRIIVAIAMQETQHMDLSESDGSKPGLSKNVSILNLNYHMLEELGYRGKNFGEALTKPAGLKTAVSYATKAMRTWTAKKFLDYHRGGRTGFDNPHMFGTQEYRDAIATMMPLLRKNIALASKNDKRIQISVGIV